ncbi:MAG: preprotein translocase subunit SecE [Planctomycetes bacterium]|nr:preprotein translocase subunit SecE [Planctomycetota bacterium]
MWCYGSFRLSETLADIRYTWARWLRTDLISEIPLFETPLKWSALVAFFVFIFGVVGLQYFLNTPKIAETLIETEAELKKVTWPTTRETIGASTVVLVTVMILFGLLGVYDMILGNVTSFIFGLTH